MDDPSTEPSLGIAEPAAPHGDSELGALLARAGLHVRVLDGHGEERYDNGALLVPAAGARESREIRVRDREAHHHLLLELPLADEGGSDPQLRQGRGPGQGHVEVAVDVTDAARGPTTVASAAGGRSEQAASGELGEAGPLANAHAELADLTADNVALRRSNRDLSEFAYIVSHDLAAPLRVISGYVQLLSRRYGDALDERAERWIDWTVDGVERMEELLAGLLTYSRLDSDGVEHRPVDLGVLVADATAALTREGAEALEVRGEGLPLVDGDPSQLGQLFANLLSNAWKFRHPDREPVVEVRAWREGQRWRLAVADNGVGIPAEHRARALRMFGRLHTREEVPGTGVGLAIAQRVVERHGGALAIDDSDFGGARLSFDLPDADAPTRGAEATSGAGTRREREEGRP